MIIVKFLNFIKSLFRQNKTTSTFIVIHVNKIEVNVTKTNL